MREARRKRRRQCAGFTLVELMASLVVFMISVLGLVSLQRATIGAGDFARQQTAAVNIARFFMTEIKTEFGNWDAAYTVPTTLPVAHFPLIAAGGSGLVARDTWQVLGPTGVNNFRVDDFLGHSLLLDTDGNPANNLFSRFCVNYMITQMEDASINPQDASVWLVRVRVSWTKNGFLANNAWENCTPGSVTDRINGTGNVQHSDNAVELVSAATREVAPPP